jgi:hypothetical protein
MAKCGTCKKEVDTWCWDNKNDVICADCIRSKGYDGDHSEYCAECGKNLGQTSIGGKDMIFPAFYIHIQSCSGAGIGTVCVCDICMDRVPDRMRYYQEKIQGNIMKFYEKKETN